MLDDSFRETRGIVRAAPRASLSNFASLIFRPVRRPFGFRKQAVGQNNGRKRCLQVELDFCVGNFSSSTIVDLLLELSKFQSRVKIAQLCRADLEIEVASVITCLGKIYPDLVSTSDRSRLSLD